MEETGSIDWSMIGMIALLAVIFICWLFIIIIRISETIDLRNNLRKIYPDVSLSPLLHSISFRYKGFKAELSWFEGMQGRYNSQHAGQMSTFCIILPDEIKQALADVDFTLNVKTLFCENAAPEVLSRNCTIKSRNAAMLSLPYNAGFLQALAGIVQTVFGGILTVTLENSKFVISLPLKLPMYSMLEFVENGTGLFDQVIAAAAAVHPEILSLPQIAGKFTVKPAEFIGAYSDEDVYDSLDGGAPVNQNPAGAKEGWGKTNDTTDDERALPEQLDN